MTAAPAVTPVAGPFFDDLTVGQRFATAPGVTLTDGLAALHQAIVGDRLRLALDATLAAAVVGPGAALAHPQLVCDVAIGQSTLPTHRVIANLFYRGLVLRRAPRIGDTLRTVTEVVALKRNRARPDTGLVALRIRTTDQADRVVLDFVRCAMLPLRDPQTAASPADDLAAIPAELPAAAELAGAVAGWQLGPLAPVTGAAAPELRAGMAWQVEHGDSVTCAPELARLSLNLATAHLEPRAEDGRRLVYGGHTIGIACAQLTRALPEVAYVLAWHSCDHPGPVYEGDVLRSRFELERVDRLARGGSLAHLRCVVEASRGGLPPTEVLVWRPVALVA